MDWNALKVFLVIAASGSLTAAAKKLGINHSTVYRRLNGFEQEMGGRLFERINNRYILTPLGQTLFDHGQKIESAFAELDRHLVGQDLQPRGIVKITAPPNLAHRYLPRYLAEFRQVYPEIIIELLVSDQEVNMNSRQADIALRATAAPPEHLVGREVASIGWSVYSSCNYEDVYGAPKNIDQLEQHRLIGGSGSMRSLPAFNWLESNFEQQIVCRSDELTAMSFMTEAGLGLAVLPDDQTRPGIEALFGITEIPASRLWLLTHPDLRHTIRIKLVMQYLGKKLMEDFSN